TSFSRDWSSDVCSSDLEGRYEIAGDDCFVMIQHPIGRGKNDPVLEAHDKYLDIQITLEGEDEIGWKARAECTRVKQEYSAESDRSEERRVGKECRARLT